MTPKQKQALRNVESILQRNFPQSLLSIVFFDETEKKMKIQTFDGTANDRQALHLARMTLQNMEILSLGFIQTVFEKDAPPLELPEPPKIILPPDPNRKPRLATEE